MENHRIRIIPILFFLLLGSNIISAQNTDCYEYLTLKEFMETKLESDTNFVMEMYKNIKYPPVARENEVEGKIEVILMNHEYERLEVLILNQPLLFHSLEQEIQAALSNLKINQEVPFITRFYVIFSLDGLRYSRASYKQFHLGLYNDNTFNIVEYIVPFIFSH